MLPMRTVNDEGVLFVVDMNQQKVVLVVEVYGFHMPDVNYFFDREEIEDQLSQMDLTEKELAEWENWDKNFKSGLLWTSNLQSFEGDPRYKGIWFNA